MILKMMKNENGLHVLGYKVVPCFVPLESG